MAAARRDLAASSPSARALRILRRGEGLTTTQLAGRMRARRRAVAGVLRRLQARELVRAEVEGRERRWFAEDVDDA